MKKCYGYIRVSTNYQVEDGLSLEFQEKEMRDYAKSNNLNLIDIYTDKAKSGRQIKGRKNLQEVIEILKPGETLLLYTLSRLARNNRECKMLLHEIEEKGCSFVSIKQKLETVTPMGRAMVGLVSVFDELESDIISERVKDGMKMKKEKGEFYGRISYGWKLSNGKGSDLIEVPEEQEVIKKIKEMKKDRETVKNIIKYLDDNKIPPPKASKRWYSSTIYGIINRETINTKGRAPKE
jgi:DNA invertase Pin-like site-specific DNA recombinase